MMTKRILAQGGYRYLAATVALHRQSALDTRPGMLNQHAGRC